MPVNRDQNTHLETLSALQHIGEAVVRGDALADVAQRLLDEAHRVIGAQIGMVCRRASSDAIDILAQYPMESAGEGADAVACMLALIAPLLHGRRPSKLEEVLGSKLGVHLKSYMEIPLVNAAGATIGAICLGTRPADVFSDEDRQFLNSLAPWLANEMDRDSKGKDLAPASGSEWIGSLAHELRNPLQRICMVSELLNGRLDAPQPSLMLKLDRATTSMEILITQLEDVLALHKGSLYLESFNSDLAPLVHRAVALAQEQARSNGVELEGPAQMTLTPILMDSGRMQQALGVLLGRLIDAAPGARVKLRCRDAQNAVHLELEVQTPAALPTALTSLLTQSNDLEMALALGILRLHGGQMSIGLGGKDTLSMSLQWAHP